MCGIAGIIGKPTVDEIIPILHNLQIRGIDATGVGLNCPDTYRTLKAGIDAEAFCQLPGFQANLTKHSKFATIALLHTRQATNGTPSNNRNNHPIWNQKGVIIHNGIVYTSKHYKAIGDTDTEQMLECITQKGLTKGIPELSGTFAFAYQSFKNRHIVYLYKHISPLCLGVKNRNIYFCSTPEILQGAIGSYHPIKLKHHTLYRIDAQKRIIEKIGKVKPKYNNYTTPYSWQHYFGEYQEYLGEELYYD